jgi:hypothetical protein
VDREGCRYFVFLALLVLHSAAATKGEYFPRAGRFYEGLNYGNHQF